MNLIKSIETCFKKYADFNGRASRSEFWWFYLFNTIVWVFSWIMPFLFFIYLALFIPFIAVAARRLHDINKSGWFQLIGLIPLVGWIIVIVWWATDGENKNNRFGKKV